MVSMRRILQSFPRLVALSALVVFIFGLFTFRIWTDFEESSPAHHAHSLAGDEQAFIGDSTVLGPPDRCIKARSRFNQYGRHNDTIRRDWDSVRWGAVQQRCAAKTYGSTASGVADRLLGPPSEQQDGMPVKNNRRPRSAIVLRSWDAFEWDDHSKAWLRALIAEASLHSGGEYQVFMLVDTHEDKIPTQGDQSEYFAALKRYVPGEFRDIALLFNQRLLSSWYPKVDEHEAHGQMYQALQIFSYFYPEFDHLWQFEMDLRLTGHIYTTLSNAGAWAQKQPRRNLWERNGQFYMPPVHGSWENFTDAVDGELGDSGVWGPVRTTGVEPRGPETPKRQDHTWGIGEEADLIALMPLIDPAGTRWVYEDTLGGWPDGKKTPRRAAVVSITRTSKQLLRTISDTQRQHGWWVISEATPETFSLLHGFKAVYVPHPISFNTTMTTKEVHELINRGPPSNRAGGDGAALLYLMPENAWDGRWAAASYFWSDANDAETLWKRYMEGQCMRSMLLHPVKKDE
ncbi:MAG: hypothetical protein M1831_000375 [Alyxoria varia]|nr:MAG: hypothetical protein M1831_000375 [Alyxoria varia]